jgi:hypothetical protein
LQPSGILATRRRVGCATRKQDGVTTDARFASTAIQSWKQNIGRLDQMFAALSDEQLQLEVAPGRNRVFYLLGHLTAVHDRMLPLLGFGERLHEELDEPFLTQPDRTAPDGVAPQALRHAWTEVNAKLTAAIDALPPEAWLDRHQAVSEQDFAKEPLRNRLAVLLSRTAHAGFHAGQITFVTKKA